MRYYLDENLSDKIAQIARARGLDVVSSHGSDRDRLDDESQLRLAAAEGRCLVTGNRNHFTLLTLRFFEMAWPHAGVLVVPASMPSDRFATVAAALLEFDRLHPDGVSAYSIHFLRPPRP